MICLGVVILYRGDLYSLLRGWVLDYISLLASRKIKSFTGTVENGCLFGFILLEFKLLAVGLYLKTLISVNFELQV